MLIIKIGFFVTSKFSYFPLMFYVSRISVNALLFNLHFFFNTFILCRIVWARMHLMSIGWCENFSLFLFASLTKIRWTEMNVWKSNWRFDSIEYEWKLTLTNRWKLYTKMLFGSNNDNVCFVSMLVFTISSNW